MVGDDLTIAAKDTVGIDPDLHHTADRSGHDGITVAVQADQARPAHRMLALVLARDLDVLMASVEPLGLARTKQQRGEGGRVHHV